MNDHDDLDLSEPFSRLTAPPSAASYAQRAPALEVHAGRSHWPQALASVVAVLVAVAGAGTFLALRNARQNGVATTSAGSPPARSGAAMAYDSTAGVTVMYGGIDAAGTALRDTWVWDGSHWARSAQPGGPGPLASARLSDDPVDGGVLLVGVPQTETPGAITGCAVGSAGGGSANGGSVSGSPPSSAGVSTGSAGTAIAAPPGLSTPVASVAPPVATVSPASRPPISPCPVVNSTSSVQTWVFDTHGWHRVDARTGAVTPWPGAQLAFDAASRQVLAVTTVFYPCGGPLSSGSTKQPDIMCPMMGAAGSSSGASAGSSGSSGSAGAPQVCTVSQCPIRVPCPIAATASMPIFCGGGGAVSTWVWSGGHWTARPNANLGTIGAEVALYASPGSGHASLLALSGAAVMCEPAVCAGSAPVATTMWTWNGSAWSAAGGTATTTAPAGLNGASVVGLSDAVVAVTSTGETWTWSGSWHRQTSAPSPKARTGEALAAGPGDTVVLFGGIAVPSKGVGFAGRSGVGSDTWVWHAGAWQSFGGSPPPQPTPCPTVAAGGSCCVEILPAQVPPAAAQPPTATGTGNGVVAP